MDFVEGNLVFQFFVSYYLIGFNTVKVSLLYILGYGFSRCSQNESAGPIQNELVDFETIL